MKGFMNTLFLSSSWKAVFQDLLLLKKKKTTDNGITSVWGGRTVKPILSFPSVVVGNLSLFKKGNGNNGSPNPAGRQILRDNGLTTSGRTTTAGFTLIELLVVVLIIGILAAAALPSYRVAVGTSRVATMYAFMRAVDQAQQHFYMQTNRYASNFDSLVVAIPAGFKKYSSTQVGNSDMFCDLRDMDSNGNPNNSVVCMEKKNHVSLVKFYIYESASCWAPSLDVGDIPNRICQNLSGRDSPSGSDSGKTGYNYSLR